MGATTRGLRGNNCILRAAIDGNVGAARHILRTVPGVLAATNGVGSTALHYAARGGHAEVCRVLLAAGAAVNARNENGLPAEDCDAGNVSVEKHLAVST